jgi:hypothetical protein
MVTCKIDQILFGDQNFCELIFDYIKKDNGLCNLFRCYLFFGYCEKDNIIGATLYKGLKRADNPGHSLCVLLPKNTV